MIRWLSLCCITLLLADVQGQQITSSTKIEVLGNVATFSCYNPAVADRWDDFFVKIFFASLNDLPSDDSMIARFQVRNHKIYIDKQQFSGRIDFSSVGNLVLSNIQLTDEGTYRCEPQAFEMSAADNQILETALTVYVAPSIEVKKVKDPLVAGADFEKAATCIAQAGKPAATVRWTYDRHLQFNQTTNRVAASRLTETVSADLHLAPTKFYNNERFVCEITHPAFTETRYLNILLNVTYPPEVPYITGNPEKTEVTCRSEGNPPPSIQWTMPDGQRITGQPTVSIITPPKSNNDTYLCTVSNGILPNGIDSITYGQLITMPIPNVEEANVGAIVGGIIGGLLLLFLIITLVYFFLLKPSRDRDPGPYKPAARGPALLTSTAERNSSRPQIQHANDKLNTSRNRPPSPNRPPPTDEDDKMELVHDDDMMSSDSSDSDEGNHDVDLEVNALNPVVNPAQYDQQPQSRSAVNFQPYWIGTSQRAEARRKRPSTSPGQRNSMRSGSRHDLTAPSRTHTPSPAPRQQQPPKYDLPPESDSGPLQYHEPSDRYEDEKYQQNPRYQQPQYVDYPKGHHQPPSSNGDSLPPYEPQYSELDHSNYKQGPRRAPFEEPVEYAQIRHSGYSHVV